LSLYDLFLGSLGIFVLLAVVFAVLLIAPKAAHAGMARLVQWASTRSAGLAGRLEKLLRGLDQAVVSLEAFRTWRGMRALGWATLISGPSHANKLLAGYVALRAIGIHANFVDILLVQTLVTFLLYFAPTPGASRSAVVSMLPPCSSTTTVGLPSAATAAAKACCTAGRSIDVRSFDSPSMEPSMPSTMTTASAAAAASSARFHPAVSFLVSESSEASVVVPPTLAAASATYGETMHSNWLDGHIWPIYCWFRGLWGAGGGLGR
jgi:hypothetical protein